MFNHIPRDKSKYTLNVYQSFIVFCPRAGLSLQTQHSPVYSLLSLPFRICIQSIYHNVSIIWYLLLPRTFFPFTNPSRTSCSRQFLIRQWTNQFLFLFLISSSIILPSPTLSSTTALFILSVYFTRSILLHTHISNSFNCFCSFRRSFQVSAPYSTKLHTKRFTNLFRSSFSRGPQKMHLFPRTP